MIVRKFIFAGSATALGLGLAVIPAAAFADDSPSMAPASRPTVTQSAGTFTVTLPGVGSLSFGIDPSSGALTALTVTPAQGSGFVAGAPMTTEEGFQVLFSGTAGSQLLEVKVDQDEAVTEVKAEVEAPDAEAQAAGAPGDDPGDDQGETTTTATPGGPPTGDDNGMETEGGDDQPTTTTTMAGPAAPSNSGDDSGSSDNGSDGGGSGSGDSGGHGSGGDGSSDGGSGSDSSGGGSGS
jgi:hypothetical protein